MRQRQIAYGDWQTPLALADAVLERVSERTGIHPATILEPTCGRGAFLVAAARRFESARLVGYDLNPRYVTTARAGLPKERSWVHLANFFDIAWEQELASMPGPILVTGNPPWVTSARLGVIDSSNLPRKQNFKGLTGYDALTGKSNFDVSEWMILRLLQALEGRDAVVAVLCKSAVARRVIEFTERTRIGVVPGGMWRFDAMQHFRAAVDAVLFVCAVGAETGGNARWPVFATLDAAGPEAWLGVVEGALVADADRFARTRHLAGQSCPEWRSGVKHDCARVMELGRRGSCWVNGLGEPVEIEDELVFPFLKSSDVANGRTIPVRGMIVPQRSLGEETASIRERAPKAWSYLSKHRELLDARKSSIYKGQPSLAVFGIGEYSFAPWKVAISGLYKRLSFVLVGPHQGRPVVLDDTCYFLPFADEETAKRALLALQSRRAGDFFEARIFWNAKRPISKAVLQSLDLQALHADLGWPSGQFKRALAP